MVDLKNILKRSRIFSSLTEQQLEVLMPLCDPRDLNPGDLLTTAGDPSQYYFILETGSLLSAFEDGKALVLDNPGDFLGLELLSLNGRYRATTTVLNKGRAIAIPRSAIISIISQDSPASETIISLWYEILAQTAPFLKGNKNRQCRHQLQTMEV